MKPRLRVDLLGLSRRGLATLVVVGALLALAGFAGLASIAGYRTLGRLLDRGDWAWFPVAFAGETAAYLGYTLAYRELVGAGRGLRLSRVLAVVASGFGIFVPRGGFVADYELMVAAGLAPREARLRVLRLGAFEYVLLAPAACAAAVFLLLTAANVPRLSTIPWALGVPAGFLLAVALLDARHRWRGQSGWRGRAGDALDALAILGRIARQPRAPAALAAAGVTLYWTGDLFCLWACLRGFLGQPPPLAALIVGYATGYTLTRRTLPLAGAGVVEASLPFALLWVKIPFAPALLAVFAYRIFNLWLPLVPAVAGYHRLRGGRPGPGQIDGTTR